MAAAESPQGIQFVIFKLAEETYAVEIAETQEVLRYQAPRPIPHSPAHVLGVINLRGQIIPIVGLREKFSIESVEPGVETRIIVTRYNQRLVGIVCDSIEFVAIIPTSNIEENPEFAGKKNESSIRGVAHLDDDSVIFLLEISSLTADAAVQSSAQ